MDNTTNTLAEQSKLRRLVNSYGVPRLIITGFLLLMFILAPVAGVDFATQITNVINRFSWNAIMVLAMVPMIHSGCGLNFGLPLGIISGLLGLLLACIGLDPLLGVPRLTFGTRFLTSGIEMIPVMIGFFAVTEVLKQTNKPSKLKAVTGKDGKADMSAKMPTLKEMWSLKGVIARCSILGTVIGILPGAGATIASFLCYSEEQKISKHPEKFGTGCLEGIAAPESGNNAATGGSMVPLLSLGIPGGNAAAIMMSALVLKGVTMGPLLLVNQPQFLSATFASMFVSNIVMVFAAMIIARIFVQVLKIPYSILGPTIIMMATIGAYSTKNTAVDVILMAISGLIGFVFSTCKFNSSAMILGLVLGVICESNLRRAYTIVAGDTLMEATINILTRPVTGIIILICILVLLSPVYKPLLKKHNKEAAAK